MPQRLNHSPSILICAVSLFDFSRTACLRQIGFDPCWVTLVKFQVALKTYLEIENKCVLFVYFSQGLSIVQYSLSCEAVNPFKRGGILDLQTVPK